jgi:hypothetical protein
MLLGALPGGTDEELSEELGVSLSTIKKTWVLIYERAAAHLAGFSSTMTSKTGFPSVAKRKGAIIYLTNQVPSVSENERAGGINFCDRVLHVPLWISDRVFASELVGHGEIQCCSFL